MNYKELTLKNINTTSEKSLLNILYNSIQDMMEIQFSTIPKHELARDIFIPNYGDIKKEIKYEYKDIKNEKTGEIKKVYSMNTPAIDETKRPKFKIPIFTQKKPDKIPVRGYFILMDAEIKIMPLGLIEVYFKGFKLPRMDKDYQNLAIIKQYTRTEYLYFDYEENKFKQLVTEDLENIKRDLKRGKKLDQLLGDEAKDVYIRTYLEREKILNIALGRLNAYAEDLQDTFLKFTEDKYDVKWKDGQIVKKSGVKLTTETTSSGILDYIERYGNTLITTIPDWLKINLIFSNITVKEFVRLLKYNLELGEKTIDINEKIKQLEQLLLKNNPSRKNQKGKVIEIKYENLDWKNKKDLYDNESTLMNTIIDELELLEKPKEIRPMEFNKQLPLLGYIYNKKLDVLFPTFAELENRRYLKEQYGSKFKDQEYIELVLEAIRESKK